MKQDLSTLVFFLNNGMCCLQNIQNSCEKLGTYGFLIVLTWMCACGNKHMMVTYIRLDATIQQ
jgi:hypothetical protein